MTRTRVATARGELAGLAGPVGVRFRGIPYAAPPVGPLRFRPPQSPEKWRGVRRAGEFGPAPPQLSDPLSLELGLGASGPQSEDCLTLNVATPAADSARRPVLVWLHGGAFATGTGAAPVYDPSALVARGAVVVTLNYRVGALGFLDLAGVSGEGVAVDLLIGTTRDEMRLYLRAPAFAAFTPEIVTAIVASRLAGPRSARQSAARAVLSALRKPLAGAGRADDPRSEFLAVETELSMREPATRLAEAWARHTPRTYMYLFTWPSPHDGGERGAFHALDLPFVFGTTDLPAVRSLTGATADARALSEKVMDAWLAFARTGDPSHPGIGEWPPYEAGRRATFELGADCGVRDAPLDAVRAAIAAARSAR